MPDALYRLGSAACATSNLARNPSAWTGDAALAEAVHWFLDDSNEGNLGTLGHRRWALNPRLGKTGFGLAGEYAAMKAHDFSCVEESPPWVAWPAPGYFPVEMFQPTSLHDKGPAWSVSLDSEIYNRELADLISVTITSKADGYEYTSRSSEMFFDVDTSAYGMPFCVIFRPTFTAMPGQEYVVLIKGLYDLQREPLPSVEYTVKFFQAEGYSNGSFEKPPTPHSPEPTDDAATRGPIPTPYRRGNPTGKGQVTVEDILLVRDFIFGTLAPNPLQAQAADVNEDGKIDIEDLLGIRDIIFNGS